MTQTKANTNGSKGEEDEEEELELGINGSDQSPHALAQASPVDHNQEIEYEIWVPAQGLCTVRNNIQGDGEEMIRCKRLQYSPGYLPYGTFVSATSSRSQHTTPCPLYTSDAADHLTPAECLRCATTTKYIADPHVRLTY